MSEQSYYELLEIPADATPEEVDRAFDRAMALYGPDASAARGVGAAEARQFVERLEEAYLTLSDPELRASYDAARRRLPAPASVDPAPEPAQSQLEFGSILRAAAAAMPDVLRQQAEPPPAIPFGSAPGAVPAAVHAPVPANEAASTERAPPGGPAERAKARVGDEATPDGACAAAPAPAAPLEAAPGPAAAEVEDPLPRSASDVPEEPGRPPEAEGAGGEAPAGGAPQSVQVRPQVGADLPEAAAAESDRPAGGRPDAEADSSGLAPSPEDSYSLALAPPRARRPAELDLAGPAAPAAAEERPAPAPAARPPPRMPEIGPSTAFNGELIRRVREARGMSLRELADRTRITTTHLENLEADRYELLPATVYLRGFLMLVARELRLDPLRVSKSYLEQAAAARRT